MLNRCCIKSKSVLRFVTKYDICVHTNCVNSCLKYCRHFSSSKPKFNDNYRVRFAPSPTGYLHLGGLRTALYNYLAAAANNGTFVLRIEDTDSNRFVPGATEALFDMLKWAQLLPSEGYGVGGSRGPYQQSERKQLYQKYAVELVKRGAAYRCFCTPLRLELLRKRGGKSGSPVPYDNKCRGLSNTRAEEMLAQGVPHCVRLKLSEIGPWEDTVYGTVPYHLDEADPVVLKTDGQATYHLANVVDDHLMAITHVIRGNEWLASTPKHLLMYQALNWTPPSYAHLPLLLNTDGSKLSKRQDHLRVEQLRRSGHSARTIINLVLGGAVHDRDQQLVYNLDELVDKFSLSHVTKKSTMVDLDRLSSLGQQDFLRRVQDAAEAPCTVQTLQDMVRDSYGDSAAADAMYVSRVLQAFTSRPVDHLQQLVDSSRSYLWCDPSCPPLTPLHLRALEAVRAAVAGVPDAAFTQRELRAALKLAHQQLQPPVGTAVLMQLLRRVLCGAKQGEPVAEVLEILGKEKSLRRLQTAISNHHLNASEPQQEESL